MHLPCKYAFKIMLISSKANNIMTLLRVAYLLQRWGIMIWSSFLFAFNHSCLYFMTWISGSTKNVHRVWRCEMDTRKGKHGVMWWCTRFCSHIFGRYESKLAWMRCWLTMLTTTTWHENYIIEGLSLLHYSIFSVSVHFFSWKSVQRSKKAWEKKYVLGNGSCDVMFAVMSIWRRRSHSHTHSYGAVATP